MAAAEPKMSKAERLAVACVVAPFIREGAGDASRRRVARVDADGNVVGYTTLAEVQKALLAKHAIEIAVQPDQRPKEKPCDRCGVPVSVGRSGKIRSLCVACYAGRCPQCGVIKKEHRSEMCRSCAYRARHGNLPDTSPCSGCGVQLKRRNDRKGGASRCLPCAHRDRAAAKRHCSAGHELSGDNLIMRKGKGRAMARACRLCTNEKARAARLRRVGRPAARSDVNKKAWITRRKKACRGAA